jgi:hypothetical protein
MAKDKFWNGTTWVFPDSNNADTVGGKAPSFFATDADMKNYSTYKKNKDVNGIYTTYERYRLDGTLLMRSVISGGTSPKYTTRVETWYGANGTTITSSTTYNITYDSNMNFVSEVKA